MSQTDEAQPRKKPFLRGGPKEAFIVLFLLVMLTRLGSTYAPIFFAVTACAVAYFVFKTAFSFGKTAGWITVAVILVGGGVFAGIQYRALQEHEALLDRLSVFDAITIQQESGLPTSAVIWISAKNEIDDSDLEELAAMPELAGVTHIFLEQTKVTDEGLKTLDRFQKLTYVFFDSERISNDALFHYRQDHPEIMVIVPSN